MQCYEVPYVRVEKSFVLNLAAEINGIRNRKCNAERAIVFQRVILQRV